MGAGAGGSAGLPKVPDSHLPPPRFPRFKSPCGGPPWKLESSEARGGPRTLPGSAASQCVLAARDGSLGRGRGQAGTQAPAVTRCRALGLRQGVWVGVQSQGGLASSGQWHLTTPPAPGDACRPCWTWGQSAHGDPKALCPCCCGSPSGARRCAQHSGALSLRLFQGLWAARASAQGGCVGAACLAST